MNIKYCPECAKCKRSIEDPEDFYAGYQVYFFQDKIGKTCQICNKDTLIETNITEDELHEIGEASNYNPQFLKAMQELKEKDIIEYELKMSQFRANTQTSTPQQPKNIPKCPTCGSINIRKIKAGDRTASIIGFGIFSRKANKTWKCENCDHLW